MALSRISRASDTRLRAPRFAADSENLIVESKTIGTDISYRMTTENFSRSGMLLEWQHRSQMPFIVNTIIEMTIDPRGTVLGAPVACLGKVVRRKDTGDRTVGYDGAQIGVQIIQMETDDLTMWEKCLALIEKKAIPLPVPEAA